MSAPAVAGNVRQAVPFFRVTDIARSLRFYVDGLGFEITNRWEDGGELRWCWLQLAGAALMLQQFATEGHDSWVPTSKVGEGVTICFMCNDAIEVFEGARTRDLAPPRPVVSNGLWITSFSDPDGYRLDFESPTDAAEESVDES